MRTFFFSRETITFGLRALLAAFAVAVMMFIYRTLPAKIVSLQEQQQQAQQSLGQFEATAVLKKDAEELTPFVSRMQELVPAFDFVAYRAITQEMQSLARQTLDPAAVVSFTEQGGQNVEGALRGAPFVIRGSATSDKLDIFFESLKSFPAPVRIETLLLRSYREFEINGSILFRAPAQ